MNTVKPMWLDNAQKLAAAKKEGARRARNKRAKELYDDFARLKASAYQKARRDRLKQIPGGKT